MSHKAHVLQGWRLAWLTRQLGCKQGWRSRLVLVLDLDLMLLLPPWLP